MPNEISLAEAAAMTHRYAANRESILVPEQQHKDILAISETLPREAIEAILNVAGCRQVRIYYGMNEALQVQAILVAVDASGANILPKPATAKAGDDTDEGAVIIDRTVRCPPFCEEGTEPFGS